MNRIESNEGFTILEVVIAVSILTIGILAVASMQVASMRGNAFAWGTSEAATTAMAQIETLMDLSYNDAKLKDWGATPHDPVRNGRYILRWTVVDNEFIARTKTVRLTVSWSDYGLNRDISMAFTLGEVI